MSQCSFFKSTQIHTALIGLIFMVLAPSGFQSPLKSTAAHHEVLDSTNTIVQDDADTLLVHENYFDDYNNYVAEDELDVIPFSIDLNNADITPFNSNEVNGIKQKLDEAAKGFGETWINRKSWSSLAQKAWAKQIIRKAESFLRLPFPEFDSTLYFTKGPGNAPKVAEMMTNRYYTWLSTLVWAECLTNNNRYLPTIEKLIRSCLNQPTWVLPGNYNPNRINVDLTSATFSHNLAQALYLLEGKISPNLRKDAINMLLKRTIQPVLDSFDPTKSYKQKWIKWDNNWNPVCYNGVLGTALTIFDDKNIRAKLIWAATEYTPAFFNYSFGGDGYPKEGMSYYNYGFTHYLVLRERIFQSTGGAIDLFEHELIAANNKTKLKNIITAGIRMEIRSGIYPGIGDSSFRSKPAPEIMWYGSRVLGIGLADYDKLTNLVYDRDIIGSVMRVFPNSASKRAPAKPSDGIVGLRNFFNSGLLIARPGNSNRFSLAVSMQGVSNGGSHRHADVGTFNLVVGGQLIMGDMGSPYEYPLGAFGANRFKFKFFSSYGHPVPHIENYSQRGIVDSKADISNSFSDNQDICRMDISKAYFNFSDKIERTFTYNRTGLGSLKVEDSFNFDVAQKVQTALTTRAAWRRAGDQIIMAIGVYKVIATIEVPAGNSYKIESEEIGLGEGNPTPTFTRIAVVLDKPLKKGKITITYRSIDPTPLPEGVYTIQAKSSNLFLDVQGRSMQNGALLQQAPYYGSNALNQHFKLHNLGNDHYAIRPIHSNKTLRIENTSQSNGANIVQWSYLTGDRFQQFRMEPAEESGFFRLINAGSGSCLDVAGDKSKSGGTIIEQRACNGSDDQKFRFNKVVDAFDSEQLATLDVNVNPSSREVAPERSVQIYPNPSSDFLRVTNAAGSQISIYNGAGQLCRKVVANSDFTEIKVHDLLNGLYTISIEKTDRQVITQQLSIVH